VSSPFDGETSVEGTLGQCTPELFMGYEEGSTPNNDGLFAIQTAGSVGAIIPEGSDTVKACFHSSGLGQEAAKVSTDHVQRITPGTNYAVSGQSLTNK
jgi:hypothetical protein